MATRRPSKGGDPTPGPGEGPNATFHILDLYAATPGSPGAAGGQECEEALRGRRTGDLGCEEALRGMRPGVPGCEEALRGMRTCDRREVRFLLLFAIGHGLPRFF